MRIILTIIISILFGLLIVLLIESSKKKKKLRHLIDGETTIDWKTLRDFYKINPSRWEYDSGYLLYSALFSGGIKIIRVKLTPTAWLKFHVMKHFAHPEDDKNMEIILESVQKDIDSLREKSHKQISEAKEIMKKVALEDKAICWKG